MLREHGPLFDTVWRDARLTALAPDASGPGMAAIGMADADLPELVYRIGFDPLHCRVWQGR